MSQDMVSFVLRFVREAGEDQQARWRGIIKHVQGNSESSFTQFSEAVAFMQEHVNQVVQTTFDETEKMSEANPFLETARMWGKFMPRYTQMMMDTMGGAMSTAGGEAISQQMEKTMNAAMSAWGMTTPASQEKTAVALKAMSEQLASLATKIESLETRIAELANVSPKQSGRKKVDTASKATGDSAG